MRWSIIRLIWLRELRDQLRDRRTVFMIVVLPVLLYPVVGLGVLQFAVGFLKKQQVVGVYGGEHLLPWGPPEPDFGPAPTAALVGRLAAGHAADRAVAAALARADRPGLALAYPPPLAEADDGALFLPAYFDRPDDADTLPLRFLAPAGGAVPSAAFADDVPAGERLRLVDRSPLDAKQVDVLLIVPPDFQGRLARGERPALAVLSRDGDDRSRVAGLRVHAALTKWKRQLREVRFARDGLPPRYHELFRVEDPENDKPPAKQAAEGLFELFVRVFPFLLVMWSLAGALYPAVDLCAGEKERGTMETLLISPVSREEIVYGKFLAIWVFSAATALLNLASMGATAGPFGGLLPEGSVRPAALLWCVLLLLPLSAFFSAVCLAVGAYARSSKEGQYYLMPLFLLTMPLLFLSLAPGVELNPFYSMVPVTGVALLLQRLMTVSSLEQAPWFYFVPVLAPMVLYGWLALRWAVEQFQREEVLFREAERLDLKLWLAHLFRDKEALPSAAEAAFCFGLLMGLRWLSMSFGGDLPLLRRSAVGNLAFVAAPLALMAVLLTTRPLQGLGLVRPTGRALAAAALLAPLLLLPLSEVTLLVLRQFPDLEALLSEHHPLLEELRRLKEAGADPARVGPYFLVLAVLPAVCEELAFRGFILGGLRRRFRPWTAVLLSSFLFAVFHMNVFQFVPTFALGVVLGLLTVRSGSVLPAVLFHLLHNTLLLAPICLHGLGFSGEGVPSAPLRTALAVVCALSAVPILWRLRPAPAPHEP